MRSERDAHAWTRAYDHLLEKNDQLVLILDATQRPGPEAGKPLALWLKARREMLATKVRLAVYVVTDPGERVEMERRSARAAKAWPYPTAFAGSFEEAERRAVEALTRPVTGDLATIRRKGIPS